MTYMLLVDGDDCRSGTNGLGGCVSAGVRETLTAVVAILLTGKLRWRMRNSKQRVESREAIYDVHVVSRR